MKGLFALVSVYGTKLLAGLIGVALGLLLRKTFVSRRAGGRPLGRWMSPVTWALLGGLGGMFLFSVSLAVRAVVPVWGAIREPSGPTTALHKAAAQGDVERIRRLLDQGVDVNQKDALGRTALHWAAREGHPEAVRLLLDYGADTTAKTKNGNTPSDIAGYRQDRAMQALLRPHDRGP